MSFPGLPDRPIPRSEGLILTPGGIGARPAESKQAWGAIWKADDRPLVRPFLWDVGVEPSAESVLGKIEQIMRSDPAKLAKHVRGEFFPVLLSMTLRIQELPFIHEEGR